MENALYKFLITIAITRYEKCLPRGSIKQRPAEVNNFTFGGLNVF